MSDVEILRLAAEHFHAATNGKEVPNYGRWKEWTTDMRKVIGNFTSTAQVLHFAQNPIELPFGHRETANPKFLDECYDILKDEFPWYITKMEGMTDNPQSIVKTMMRVGSQFVSNMFFWHLFSLLTIQTHVPNIKSVIEIGGGDGALARLWCLYFPVDHYTIVDLPESLYFSEVCLREAFGNTGVAYFPEEARITLVPVDQLVNYKRRRNIVVSIGSIQEMHDDWVDYYMKWLDDCGAEHFYSLNYAAQPMLELKESRCWWGPRPSAKWSTKLLSLDPAIIRVMCSKRHFLQALYRKRATRARFSNWSVLWDHNLTLATYLEGLDMLRQDPNERNIKFFMNTVLSNPLYGNKDSFLPKEMYALAGLVDCKASKLIKDYLKTGTQRMCE